MKNKKILAVLLAAATTIGCLAGCGQQATTNQGSEVASESKVEESKSEVSSEIQEEPSLFNAPGTLPIVNEPVTLKVITLDQTNVHNNNETENSKLWEWLEEKTGVHFEVESYPTEELAQKMPLIMATPDEMPDLIWRCNLSVADVLNYGTNGQLLMLDDLIEEYAPNIQYCFDNLEGAYGAAVSADNHIYSLPSFNGYATDIQVSMNKKYLDNVGMNVPTNFEELYEVFKAIKAHGDANGDGIQNNEFCWSGHLQFFRRSAMVWGGFNCYWPWKGAMFDNDGDDVFFVNTSERYKELLTWLNKFYEEGMIDPEVFTQSKAEYAAKLEPNLVFVKYGGTDPEAPGFTGPEGDFFTTPVTLNAGETPLVTLSADYQADIGAVSAYTEYPEICVMVMDFLYSEEGSMVASMGMEGVDFTVVSEDPFIVERTDEEHGWDEGSSEYACLVPRWCRNEWVQPASTQMKRDRAALVEEYGVFSFQNYVKFTAEEADSIATLNADLGLFCDDYFVGFINGTYDIEKDWDAYVAECKKMKCEELEDIYQIAYNRYYGK